MDERKPIDIVKTQLHYIVNDLDKISKHLTEIRGDLNFIKEHIKKKQSEEDLKKKQDAIERQKIESGWRLF